MANETPTPEGAPPTVTQPTAASTHTPAGEAPPAVKKPWNPPRVKVGGYERSAPARSAPTAQDKPAPPAAAAGAAAGSAAVATSSDPKGSAAASGAGTPAAGGSAAKSEPASAAAKPADKQPEIEKLPLGKGWQTLMEKEASLRAEREAFEAERRAAKAAAGPDPREVGKKSKLEGLQALGWTLEEIQEEYLEKTRGSASPEEIARRAARAEFERLEKEKADTADREKRDREEATRTEFNNHLNSGRIAISEAAGAMLDELEVTVALGKTNDDVLQWYLQQHNAWPTDHAAALREHEAELRKKLAGKGFAKAAPAPAAEPAKVEAIGNADRTVPVTRPRTAAAVTPDAAGEVPLRASGKRRETAIERVRRITGEVYGGGNDSSN